MRKIKIANALMRFDTTAVSFDMQEIDNRRFMFNPKTGTLVLGYQYDNKQLYSSHAEEFSKADTDELFDDFVRGWIGVGGKYRDGVIHFVPSVSEKDIELFESAFDTLEMFAKNGATGKTVVRGFGKVWEQPFSNLIKDINTRLLCRKQGNQKTAQKRY